MNIQYNLKHKFTFFSKNEKSKSRLASDQALLLKHPVHYELLPITSWYEDWLTVRVQESILYSLSFIRAAFQNGISKPPETGIILIENVKWKPCCWCTHHDSSHLVVGVDVMSWSVNCPHCMTIMLNWVVSCLSSRWILALIMRGLGKGPLERDLLNSLIPSLIK